MCEESVLNPHICEQLCQIITCEKLVSKLTRVKNWYRILTHVKNWYQTITDVSKLVLNRHRCPWQNCEELESNAKYIADYYFFYFFFLWGEYFNNVRNTHVCYMKFDFVRMFHQVWDIGTKYVTYWYQLFTCCDELALILDNVKFAKCEVCSST